jgi:segregation and condensation protein B
MIEQLDEVESASNESPAGDELVETIVAESVMEHGAEQAELDRDHVKAIVEALIYVTDEPLTGQQIAGALGRTLDEVRPVLEKLAAEYARPDRGLSIREVAGGYKMETKPEHHEEIRQFVKNLKPPLKLSLAALETLAVVAYKQPITAPEIMEIRGVQGAGVLKTLLDRKLIATAGRKNVIGKPILYKTTKDFLVQFGLKDLAELPTLKEFEELGRLAISDSDEGDAEALPPPATEPQADGADAPVPEPEPGSPAANTPPIEPPPELPMPHEDPPEPAPDPIQEPPSPIVPEKAESSTDPDA